MVVWRGMSFDFRLAKRMVEGVLKVGNLSTGNLSLGN